MKKLSIMLAVIVSLWSFPVMAANITATAGQSGSASMMGMSCYVFVLDLEAAADGSGSYDFADNETVAAMFTKTRPGVIAAIKVDLDTVATPTTLFDVYLYDGDSTLKKDWLAATGVDLAVTANTILYVRNGDGQMVYQGLTSPPVLTVANAGNGGKARFTFIIMR